MKKKIADKWVKALRSGKYKQGDGALKDAGGRYCCLGVLCEVRKVPSSLSVDGITIFGGSSGSFPGGYMKKASLKDMAGEFDLDKVKWPRSMPKKLRDNDSLAQLNDSGATFKQIAAFIELNYRVL